MAALSDAHLLAQEHLRKLVARAVGVAWTVLPAYDRANIPQFLEAALPVVLAGQRQSALLVDAYLARALDRPPVGIDPALVVGAEVRNGTTPDEVYRRAFVQTWAALGNGVRWEDAVAQGLNRVTSSAEMDVQLSSRAAFGAVQARDSRIVRWRRVPDAGACAFCLQVAGAVVKSASAMPLHNHCGCSLEPVDQPLPVTPTPDGTAVHEHGELGAVLGAPGENFTGPSAVH